MKLRKRHGDEQGRSCTHPKVQSPALGGVCRLLSEKSSVHLNHFRVRAPFKLHDHVLALLSQLRVGSGYARYEGVPNINSLIFEIRVGPATWPAAILLRGPKEPFVRPATGLGGEGSLSILLVIWSPRGPRVPVARPGARWAADRSPDAARNATGTSTGTGATFAGH